MLDWQKTLVDIEERVFPYFALDTYERLLYYYLINQTRLRGFDTITITIPEMSCGIASSDGSSRKAVRSLAQKGCISAEQTRKGYSIKAFLPEELDLPLQNHETNEISLEDIDFFKERSYISALTKREQGMCFYCLSVITEQSCELDHVVPQAKGGNNSYRNIVVACHRCNTRKLDSDAQDFLRSLYRKGMLSDVEFDKRLAALEALGNGELEPIL